MRFVVLGAAVAAALAFAEGPAPHAPDATFTVMTFNIQHGIDGTHKYNLQRAIDVIARAQPDLVGLQEVTRNHPYYNCDDQPKRIAQGLEAATGRRWNAAYEQEWFTPNVECQQGGRGDGKETEGLAFFSPEPLGPTMMTPLPVSRIALAVRFQGAGRVPVTVTHFASGKENAAARAKEAAALAAWTAKLGEPQILMGDFNAGADDAELQPIVRAFRDGWKEAAAARVSKGHEGTHGDHRIDYVFFKSDRLELVGVETLDTATWLGGEASDHRPIVAHFRTKERPQPH